MIDRKKSAVTPNDGDDNHNEIYRTLFEQAADGIFVSDANGRYVDVNPRGCEMLGYTREEILSKAVHDLISTVDLHTAPLKLDQLHPGNIVVSERNLICKDGSLLPVEISARRLSDGRLLGITRDISERKQTEQLLVESEARYRYLFENNPHPMWVYDLETLAFLAVNDAATAKYGYSREEFLSMTIKDIRPQEDLPRLLENLAQPRLPLEHSTAWRHRLKDGTIIDVEISSHIIELEGHSSALVIAQDVTERKKAEARVRYMTRLYATLSQVNQTIVRIETRDELFQSICEVAVELGEFHMAWIGLINRETSTVEPVSHAGHGRDYLDSLVISVEEGPLGWGPTGTAIRSGKVEFSDNIAGDERMKPWREAALKRGFHSSAAVPLRQDGKIIGTLNLYAREPGFFSEEERSLLEEIGLDISYALDRIEAETERIRAENALRASERNYQSLAETMTALYETTRDLVSERDLTRLLHTIVERAARLLNTNAGGLYLADPQNRRVKCLVSYNTPRDYAGVELDYGEGAAGLVAETEEPFIVNDYSQWSGRARVYEKEKPFRAVLSVPMKWQDELIGVIHILDYSGAREFTEADKDMMLLFANQAAIAVKNASLYTQAQEELAERKQAELLQEAVYKIAQTAQTSESLEELVPQIHLVIGSIMPAGNFYIALYDEAHNRLNFPYSVDEIDPPISGSLPLGKGLTEYVLRTGKSLLCPQSVHDELEQAGEIELVGAPAPIWLGVPLKVDSKTIGVMAVQHYSDPLAYGEREQRILEFVSSQAAIALSRKQAETALRESESRFATVFRSSPMAIAITRVMDGRLLDVNDAWLNLTGFSREEVLGHSTNELGIWADPAERDRLIESLGRKRTVEGFELTVRKKSGELADILLSAELIELVGVPSMLTMALDIGERKRAESKIRQQLDRLTALSTVDRVIASSFDLGMTLNMLVSTITQQLEVSAALVLLYNPNALILEYAAGHGFRSNDVTRLNIHLGEGHASKVALERRMAHIPDLSKAKPPFSPNITEIEEFVSYFGLPLIAKGEVKGVLEVFHRQPLDPDSDWLAFLETMAEQAAIAIDNMQLFEGMQRSNLELSLAYDATIEGWSYALDLRDKETEGHTQRVTEKTVELARAFGLGNRELLQVRRGALLHDIGKMGVPDSILLKPGALTEEEWVVMKMHPTFARQMLERIQYLKPALDIPYCHHEKWDGSGYPRGLSGKQIPLPARIFAVVDVWDALGSDRPYRPAWPRSEVIKYIKAGAGSHFDPEVVELFLSLEPSWNTQVTFKT